MLALNMKALKGEEMTGTDAEACAYLYTAALTNPMDHDWGQIYLYIATQTYRQWGKNEMPADITMDKLDDNQMMELRRLKQLHQSPEAGQSFAECELRGNAPPSLCDPDVMLIRLTFHQAAAVSAAS
jgi:hypothetical protein